MRGADYFARNEESSLGLHITTDALYIGTERHLWKLRVKSAD